jgi:GT2 family glycosyltransferase
LGDKVRLSVVIAALDAGETIGNQLAALASQRWSQPWEVVVADNGSSDRTRDVVESFRGRLPALRIVDARERPGVAFARNRGVEAAAGDLLAFCDADDEVAAGWVGAIGDGLAQNAVVAGRIDTDSLNPPWLATLRGHPQAEGLMPFGDQPPFAGGGNLGVRREVHDAIGGFDEDFGLLAEDTDYCWRIQAAGWTLRFEPGAVVAYRLRPELSAIFRQARTYASGYVALYAKYRSAFPRQRHPWISGLASWLGVVRHLPLRPTRRNLGHFAWHLGWKVGMLEASAHYRVPVFSVRGLPFPGMPGPA